MVTTTEAVLALIDGLLKRDVQTFEGLGIKITLYPSATRSIPLDDDLPPAREAIRQAAEMAQRAMQDEEDMLNWST